MGRHEMRWEELRWDELKWSASVKCGVWSVKNAMWSVRKVFAWQLTLHRGLARVMFLDNNNCSWSCSWSVKCGLWSVEYEVWNVECEVWSVKCGVGRVQCEVWSVECEKRSEKCEVRSGASNVTCETGHHFRRMHTRTTLTAHGACKFYRWERVFYIIIYIYPCGYYWYGWDCIGINY